MKIHHILFAALLLALPIPSLTLSAQVNMGSLDAPVKAGILQIKQHEPTDPFADNQTVSTGALALPRVKLKQLTSLSPLLTDAEIAAADYATQKKKHIGAMVFNTTIDATAQLVLSIYVWNGETWQLQRSDSAVDFAVWGDKNVLEFPSGLTGESLVAQNLTINRSPVDVANQLSMDHILNGGVSYTPPATITANPTVLPILPLAMSPADIAGDPLKEKISNLNLTITDGASSVTQKIILRQIHYSIQIATWKTGEVVGDENEVNSGRTYTLKVRSNADWKVEVDDPSVFVALGTYPQSGVANVVEGVNYNFQINNEDVHVGKIVKLTFKSQEADKCKDVVVRLFITKEYPNTYIIDPTETSFIFPITKAFLAWEQDRDLNTDLTTVAGAYGVNVLWQDQVGMVTNVQLIGTGKNAQVFVNKTAGVKGNALVQLTIGGVVYWSWQLWITDYNPNGALTHLFADGVSSNIDVNEGKVYSYFNTSINTVLMDRNLGALSVAPGKNTSYGYYYEHGRKDPFPPREITESMFPNGTIHKHIDMYAGTSATIYTSFKSIGVNNVAMTIPAIQYGIHNPHMHISSTVNDTDWYSATLGVHRQDLWMTGDGKKTIFDPCPAGWRAPPFGTGQRNILLGLTAKQFAPGVIDCLDYTAENFGIVPITGVAVAYDVENNGSSKFRIYGANGAAFGGAYVAGASDMKGILAYNSVPSIGMSQRQYSTPIRCVRDESLNRK